MASSLIWLAGFDLGCFWVLAYTCLPPSV